MKIGVFDSGVGGLTVLGELKKALPEADYVYFGDTANVPYGTKSAGKIESLSRTAARKIRQMNVDALVVACNTASSWAFDAIREEMGDVPVFGVVEPGVDAAIENRIDGPIVVLATRATVRSHAYISGFKRKLGEAQFAKLQISEQACPLLVPLIEEGWVDHPVLHQVLKEYLSPFADHHPRGVAVLGCTHFPWIQSAVEKALPGWVVVNSAKEVAEQVRSSLSSLITVG